MKILSLPARLVRAAFRPIEANAVFFTFIYVLGVVCAYLTLPNRPTAKVYDNLLLELFFDLYVLCAVLMLIPRRVRRWAKLIVAAVLYVVAFADMYCFQTYDSTLTPSLLLLALETNGRETAEFLHSLLSWETLRGGTGRLLLIAAGHAVCAGFSVAGVKGVKKYTPWNQGTKDFQGVNATDLSTDKSNVINSFNIFNSQKTLNLLNSLKAIPLCLLLWSAVASWENKQATWQLLSLDTIGQVEDHLHYEPQANLYLPVYRLAFSIRANQLAAAQVRKLVTAADRVQVDSCSHTSPLIVLIIGESYGKHHSQLYGYYMPTTPRQKQREATGQLVKFTDVVTPWNLTSFVFKHMFSLHVIGQQGEWCDAPLFPQLFRRAGYDVTFLTNQFLPKTKEAVYDFSGGFFLNNPTLSEAMFTRRNTATHTWDDGLLSDYDHLNDSLRISHSSAAQADPLSAAGSQLVIFHLLGQHMNYHSRFPHRQRHFQAADYDRHRPKMLPRRKRILADYDNAVLYNDSIVDQIISRFEQEDAIVVYVPDHGEEVYEPGRLVICRNHTTDIDFPLAYYEYEIPLWIWCSKEYIARRPDLFRQIKAARQRRLMTDALPHTLLYLAGIHSPDYHEQYDILSPRYDELRPRLLRGHTDYDSLPRDMSSKKTANLPKR